ncbi:hypothetical protein ACFYMX_17600 [Streptomyces griseofuscus]|nr:MULTISPECIES: hypothetical protein [unclassified Streptomyces]MBJ7005274.1 hypothetical protein [Streptomyces sp. CRPSP2-6A1]MYQ90437.1 hypothetical protein [Streptomyces sp. SID4946]
MAQFCEPRNGLTGPAAPVIVVITLVIAFSATGRATRRRTIEAAGIRE